jgi:L-histidine N-alpha-methyltransferase
MTTLIAEEVARGLMQPDKSLPPWLFYDDEGSRLYEAITELPEYYPTRTERAIFEEQADAIVAAAAAGSDTPLRVVELGAGTATKSQLLLQAITRRQASCRFMPVDVSAAALGAAVERLRVEEPRVVLEPLRAMHEEAFPVIRGLAPRKVILFIGSSIGNFEDEAAIGLLRGIRSCLQPGEVLVLGTDLRKSPDELVPAYDDAQGVTAAFNKNLLTRINREMDADFNLDRFRHVALWNQDASRIEMHLESMADQRVRIGGLDQVITFRQGERIHTECSKKYDEDMVRGLLLAADMGLETTFYDRERRFAVHLARVG